MIYKIWLRIRNAIPSINSSFSIASSFIGMILIGTFLLMLPISSQSGQWTPLIDALFTATSASCVTGLAVLDTGKHFSLFGKTVIILLIQIGGLGIMTITTLFSVGIGRRLKMKQRFLMQDALNQDNSAEIEKITAKIIKYTLFIEFVFGTILAWYLYDDYGMEAIYWGYWHAVSAFCNAGFDLLGDFTSFVNYRGDIVINVVLMTLIILGGIGFSVIGEVIHIRKWRDYSLHTQIVLTVNTALIVLGTLFIFFSEMDNPRTLAGLGLGEKLLASCFQSVSARTAGFNTIDIGAMQLPGLFIMACLMFVGASPNSTGGGIKTTTMAVIWLSTLSLLRDKKEVVIFKRRVDQNIISKSTSVFVLACLWLVLATFLLLCFDTGNHPLQLIIFELFSAFGTVGLGVGITTEWNGLCKLVLIATMFVGRIGILTFSLSFFNKKIDSIRYPSENIFIG